MAKASKANNAVLKIIKLVWIPVLLIFAFILGTYIGYQFITDTSGANIFSVETWKSFFEQIGSLR